MYILENKKTIKTAISSLFADDFSHRISDRASDALGCVEQPGIIRANFGNVTLGNIFAGFLSVLAFVGSDQFLAAILWYLAFLCVATFTMIRSTRRAKDGKWTDIKSDKYQLMASLILGLSWAGLPLILFGDANMEQRLFIVAIMLSLVGVGAFFLSGVPRAAVVFSMTVIGGLLAAILLNWHARMLNPTVLILAFALLLVGLIRKNGSFLIDRIEARIALVESNEMISVLLREHEDSGYEWLWETNSNGKIANVSKKFAQAVGVDEEVLEGRCFVSMLEEMPAARSDQGGNNIDKIDNVDDAFHANAPFRDIAVSYQHPDGGIRWWKLSGRPIVGHNVNRSKSVIGYRGIALDITETKNSEDKIAYLALYDSLTNLPNRASFKEQIDRSIAKTGVNGFGVALFVLDLDKFKHINDTLGHPAGDELLVMVAKRLSAQCNNATIVARLGGDEFSIVVENVSSVEEAEKYAMGLVSCFKERFFIAGRNIGVNCSIGVGIAPVHGDNSGELIKNADLALYRAKSDNSNSFKVFEAGMDLRIRERRRLGQELQMAISNGELFLVYQPLICAKTDEIIGYEALARWKNPRCGTINPEIFIPIAEELGLIGDVGRWAIHEACREAASWKNRRRVSVNLSPLQFVGIQLELVVARALGDSGLLPSRLELEITENSLMVNKDATLVTLQNLRNLGISIALDDFGTGYSSLSYLMSYPFDKIKIDRSFLTSNVELGKNAAIIRTIIGLAKSLGMRTTVEGVETMEHFHFLTQEGCDELQGYLLSPPILPSQLDENDSADIFPLSGKLKIVAS